MRAKDEEAKANSIRNLQKQQAFVFFVEKLIQAGVIEDVTIEAAPIFLIEIAKLLPSSEIHARDGIRFGIMVRGLVLIHAYERLFNIPDEGLYHKGFNPHKYDLGDLDKIENCLHDNEELCAFAWGLLWASVSNPHEELVLRTLRKLFPKHLVPQEFTTKTSRPGARDDADGEPRQIRDPNWLVPDSIYGEVNMAGLTDVIQTNLRGSDATHRPSKQHLMRALRGLLNRTILSRPYIWSGIENKFVPNLDADSEESFSALRKDRRGNLFISRAWLDPLNDSQVLRQSHLIIQQVLSHKTTVKRKILWGEHFSRVLAWDLPQEEKNLLPINHAYILAQKINTEILNGIQMYPGQVYKMINLPTETQLAQFLVKDVKVRIQVAENTEDLRARERRVRANSPTETWHFPHLFSVIYLEPNPQRTLYVSNMMFEKGGVGLFTFENQDLDSFVVLKRMIKLGHGRYSKAEVIKLARAFTFHAQDQRIYLKKKILDDNFCDYPVELAMDEFSFIQQVRRFKNGGKNAVDKNFMKVVEIHDYLQSDLNSDNSHKDSDSDSDSELAQFPQDEFSAYLGKRPGTVLINNRPQKRIAREPSDRDELSSYGSSNMCEKSHPSPSPDTESDSNPTTFMDLF